MRDTHAQTVARYSEVLLVAKEIILRLHITVQRRISMVSYNVAELVTRNEVFQGGERPSCHGKANTPYGRKEDDTNICIL